MITEQQSRLVTEYQYWVSVDHVLVPMLPRDAMFASAAARVLMVREVANDLRAELAPPDLTYPESATHDGQVLVAVSGELRLPEGMDHLYTQARLLAENCLPKVVETEVPV